MGTPYWKWSAAHKRFYHQELNPRTGNWDCTWKDNVTPRPPIVSYTRPSPNPRPITHPDPHPVDPYGSRIYPVHTPSHTAGATIDQGLARLNIGGGQTSPRSLHSQDFVYPQSRSRVVTARPEASGQRGAVYYSPGTSSMLIEPSQPVRTAERVYTYQAPQNQYDQLVAGGRGLVQDRRTSFNREDYATSHYQTSRLDKADGRHDKAQTYASESQTGGSSQEAQTSSASYSIPTSMSPRKYSDSFADHRIEKLNPREYKQMHNPRKFFIKGRVFIMFHIENAGQTADHASLGGTNFTPVAYGEIAHHQFRRFVVVEEVPSQFFSYCCPITTHGGRATTKPGVDQTVHTIVYSTDDPPGKMPGEEKMLKDPLRIVLCSPDDKLDPKSRINLGRVHSIDHNVKVKQIGDVHPRSLPKLLGYRKTIRDKMT